MPVHTSKYSHFETVYLKTDPEQFPRTIVEIMFPPGATMYTVMQGASASNHFEQELTSEPDQLLKVR